MKKLNSIGFKLFILTTIVLLFLASQFTNPNANEKGFSSASINSVPDSQFIIGAFHNAVDLNYLYKDSFSFNTWHQYTGPYWGWLNDSFDHYDIDYKLYQDLVTTKINQNKNDHNMRTLMDRPIIEYLVGGQRIDYQCENIAPNFEADPYWYYAYNISMNNSTRVNDIIDTSQYGNGEKVKWCKVIQEAPVFGNILINSGLRSNREMSFNQVNQWMKDTEYEWYVMPRIRIDSAYAADNNHISDTICKIVVTGWKGNIEAEFALSVSSFKGVSTSSYNGNYMESFYDSLGNLKYLKIDKSKLPNFTDTTVSIFDWSEDCKCDIKIYWTGKCDMWIDRVRIENLPAHQYLTLKEDWLLEKVKYEIDWSKQGYSSSNPNPNYFYFEECQMSHYPMIKELNKQITDSTGNKNELVIWLNYDLFKAHVPNSWSYQFDAVLLKKYLYDYYGLRTIVMGSYALEGWKLEEPVDDYRSSYHPSTLFPDNQDQTYDTVNGILSYKSTPAEYDTWLQEHFDDPYHPSGVNYTYISKLMYELSKQGMRIINCPQAHLWYSAGHKLKEPSNEELELQANLALTYNAKGIMWFPYVADSTVLNTSYYCRGVMDNGITKNSIPVPRDSNVYKQNKYQQICHIDSILEKRGKYIMSFISNSTKNCSYRNYVERPIFLSTTYFCDIITFKPGSGSTNCEEQNPGGLYENLSFECNDDRYIQAATFETGVSDDINKYFMIVNKRCSPYKPEINENGGRRNIRIRFDINPAEFAAANNWQIINLDDNSIVQTFDKTKSYLLDLGWFMPGEGRLYKIAPTVQEGGTLVCDEEISNTTIHCKGMIYNDGYNLTFGPGTQMYFNENAGITMDGGSLYISKEKSNSSVISFYNEPNTYWKGITLNNCYGVCISNAKFRNVNPPDSVNTFIINLFQMGNNLYSNYVNSCNFDLTGSAAAISFNNVGIKIGPQEQLSPPPDSSSNEDNVSIIQDNILSNTFTTDGSNPDLTNVVHMSAYAGSNRKLLINNNNFSVSGQNTGQTAVMITEYSGNVKGNVITGFDLGMNIISGNINLFGNIITNTNPSGSTGAVSGESIGFLNLSPASKILLGGNNSFSVRGSNTILLNINDSKFDLSNGNNVFSIIDSGAYQVHGFGSLDSDTIKAGGNCYYVNGNYIYRNFFANTSTDPQTNYVFAYGGNNTCPLARPFEVDTILSLGEDLQDTIYRLSITPPPDLSPCEMLVKTTNVAEAKGYFETVKSNCEYLLANYANSIQTDDIVNKLYVSTINLDTNGQMTTDLKSFYESIIQNNPDDDNLIICTNYYIQKCKVALGDYSSALLGFQQIMQENQYTYLGLVASWDYAATVLLMDTTLTSGGMKSNSIDNLENKSEEETKERINVEEQKQYELISEKYYSLFEREAYDSTKFKKEDRKKIKEILVKTGNGTRKKNIDKFDETKVRSEKGDEKAKIELKKMKSLKETVKTKKPKDHIELKKIVNSDIKKVFSTGKQNKSKDNSNLIPAKFELYQNYPNPFNPTTKIAYDIPHDSKVKLIIYDILGREMKTLVNNEFKQAGKYITEFNASNLSSGVYFARILVNEGKDFIAVKKLVLLK
jgi:hypothetical protein